MASSRVSTLMTTTTTGLVLLLLLLQPVAAAGGADRGAIDDLQYRRHRRYRHARNRNSPSPGTPTAPVVPVQPVRPPPPLTPATNYCNDTYGPEEALTASGDVCVPRPATSPPVPPPRRVVTCPPCTCTCPRQPQPPRPFPWWPVPRPLPVPVPGRGSSSNAGAGSGSGSYDCIAPLSPMMTCGKFLMGNETDAPTPTSDCCSGLAAFLRTSSAAAAAGGGDHMLRCLCPVILGDVNKMLPRPVDPVRMMYLPIACGVVLPPQLLYVCFTGRPSPVVTSFPQQNQNPESDPSP